MIHSSWYCHPGQNDTPELYGEVVWWQRDTRKGQDARDGELQYVKKPHYSSGTERVRRGQKEQLSGKLEPKRIRNKTWDSTESLWQESPRCPSEPEQLISNVHCIWGKISMASSTGITTSTCTSLESSDRHTHTIFAISEVKWTMFLEKIFQH